MRQPRGTIWAERTLVILIMASLAGTVNLVMAVHRRAATRQVPADRSPRRCRSLRPPPP